jgi:GNAT superfamily N-acetyltransferase
LIRRAAEPDLDAIAETLALAFEGDPVWGWAFEQDERDEPGQRQQKLAALGAVFRFLAAAALAHEWVWLNEDGAAVALWIPPSRPEMSVEDAERFPSFLEETCGPLVGQRALEMMENFERNHPAEPSHYYLSLLGTHPDHAGKGLGMGLVEANLELIDDEGVASYLESTNPANLRRYERVGFRPRREFELLAGISATQMWREA